MSRTSRYAVVVVAALLATLPQLAAPSAARATCASSQVGLGPPVGFLAGVSPFGSVLTDVDGDGILDVLVAISHLHNGIYSGEVTFVRGLGQNGVGNGTFAQPVQQPAGATPFGLVAGDLDGDGITDVVVTNESSNTVSVLIGQGSNGRGDGTFVEPVTYPAGLNPHHIVMADFNHDGILDLAVANNGVATVSVLLGNGTGGVGNGTFRAPVAYATRSTTTGLVLGDLDEDGITDLLVTESATGSLAWLRGNGSGGVGDGTFTVASHIMTGGVPYDVTLADVNGDHHLDALVALAQGGGLYLLPGNGDGTFGAQTHLISGSIGMVRAADMDGDGILDLVLTQPALGLVTELHGNGAAGVGNGTFTWRAERTVASTPYAFALGDCNGDGLTDVVVGEFDAMDLALLPGDCSPVPLTYGITGVRDVPFDQGGQLWLTWTTHPRDVANGEVIAYRVWRRVPAPAAAARASRPLRVTPSAAGPVYWEEAARLDAQRLTAYAYTAATAQDSIAGHNPYTTFFVTAATANPEVFYDTAPDSGYSVDNLAPAAPAPVTAWAGFDHDVYFMWPTGAEADLSCHRIYRGSDPFFVPAPANLAKSVPVPASGTNLVETWVFYKLAAVDVHGNESPYVLVQPGVPLGATVAFVSAVPAAVGATLAWYADPSTVTSATLEREVPVDSWQVIGTAAPDAGGRLVFADPGAAAGGAFAYRLDWTGPGGTSGSVAATALVPRPVLALAAPWPNPAPSAHLALGFTLADATPATLELFDVGGRRVLQRAVGTLGPGAHTLSLGSEHLRCGMYVARLAQGAAERHVRVVVL